MDSLSSTVFCASAALACALLQYRSSRRAASFPDNKLQPPRPSVLSADPKMSEVYKLAKQTHLNSEAQAALQARDSTAAPLSEKRIYTVALTGGPCSGKSSSLAHFTRALTKRGFDVYAVPEVPTIIMNAGFPYPGLEGGELLMEFELALAKSQLQLEDTVKRLAAARDSLQRKRPCVVIFDRGLMDMKAYMSFELWSSMLDLLSLDQASVMARYDLALHLESAAYNAEAFYTVANNTARTETVEEARQNDDRVKAAWLGHPNWRHVPNRQGKGFEEKMHEATSHVLELVTAVSSS